MSDPLKASRTPVFVFPSFFVNALLGNGRSFGVGAACAAAGVSRTSASGRGFRTPPNLHRVRSRVHAALRAPLRLRAEHRGAPRAVPAGASRALPGVARE